MHLFTKTDLALQSGFFSMHTLLVKPNGSFLHLKKVKAIEVSLKKLPD